MVAFCILFTRFLPFPHQVLTNLKSLPMEVVLFLNLSIIWGGLLYYFNEKLGDYSLGFNGLGLAYFSFGLIVASSILLGIVWK